MTRLLSFILALLVTLTTVHMGQARGVMASVAGHVTICNGQGTEVLTLEVSGDPVEVSHSCPQNHPNRCRHGTVYDLHGRGRG